MRFNATSFPALMESLRLTQAVSKPDPGAFTTSAIEYNNTSIPGLARTPPPASVQASFMNLGSDPWGASSAGVLHDASCNIEICTGPPPPTDEAFPPFDPVMAKVYRYRRQQSVNLGSWFVNENWMTPSLFKCASGNRASELDIASGWGSPESARSLLECHWDTWITQSDFQYLASIGINTVRLPIGYWNLGPDYCRDTPFDAFAEVYQNSWVRILRAINMARKVGIGVLVDLHGAVGSQNGQSHSGISDGATNLFNDPLNVNKTIAVLTHLAKEFAPVTNVVGIQVLNEPQNVAGLYDFYSQAISSIREVPGAASLPLYIHNGFDLERCSDYVANRRDFVVQDHHSYFVFTPSDEAEPASQHTSDIKGTITSTLDNASAKQHRNIVVDEWSCALTPQSLYDEPDKDQAREDFCTGQLNTYTGTTAGWSFWSYKKEGCEADLGWCFTAAVGKSLPWTFFSYPVRSITDAWKVQSLATNITLPSAADILLKFPGVNVAAAPTSPWSGRRGVLPSGAYSTLPGLQHRFEVIHTRYNRKREDSPSSAAQLSTIKGYSDGFLLAKNFATTAMSKLGFSEQYIIDSMAEPGATIIPGTESNYHDSFILGLQDSEAVIMSLMNSNL